MTVKTTVTHVWQPCRYPMSNCEFLAYLRRGYGCTPCDPTACHEETAWRMRRACPNSAHDRSRHRPGGIDRDRSTPPCRMGSWSFPLPCIHARAYDDD